MQTLPSYKTKQQPPSDDKRWRIVDTTMRRHGNSARGLIETLHNVQQIFGYLDDPALTYVAHGLRVPLSKVYGVATFYNLFRMKPQGEHTCVVCMGTACYIKGGPQLLNAIEKRIFLKPDQTTADNKVSLLTARCVGACGLAPVAVLDGTVVGNIAPTEVADRISEWVKDGK